MRSVHYTSKTSDSTTYCFVHLLDTSFKLQDGLRFVDPPYSLHWTRVQFPPSPQNTKPAQMGGFCIETGNLEFDASGYGHFAFPTVDDVHTKGAIIFRR